MGFSQVYVHNLFALRNLKEVYTVNRSRDVVYPPLSPYAEGGDAQLTEHEATKYASHHYIFDVIITPVLQGRKGLVSAYAAVAKNSEHLFWKTLGGAHIRQL